MSTGQDAEHRGTENRSSYRTGTETPKNVELYLEEIGDIRDHIERGPHWDTVQIVKITRINHTDSPELTLEQAAELGRRTIHKKP